LLDLARSLSQLPLSLLSLFGMLHTFLSGDAASKQQSHGSHWNQDLSGGNLPTYSNLSTKWPVRLQAVQTRANAGFISQRLVGRPPLGFSVLSRRTQFRSAKLSSAASAIFSSARLSQCFLFKSRTQNPSSKPPSLMCLASDCVAFWSKVCLNRQEIAL
jgi:hypothetical protein